MEFTFSNESPLATDADFLVICTHGDPAKDALFKQVDQALGGHLSSRAKAEEFVGKAGQVLFTDRPGGAAARALAIVGAGEMNGFDAGRLRDNAAGAIRVARRAGARRVVIALPPVSPRQLERSVQLAVEGALLGSYRFTRYRAEDAKKADPVAEVVLTADRGKPGKRPKLAAGTAKAMKAAISRARVVARAVCHARDLINEPAAVMTPVRMADEAKAVAKEHGLQVKVLPPAECAKLGMGMFLAVGQGSDQEARLIHMTYTPAKKAKGARKIALIGKGITFDSGGYSLKPTQSMEDMKTDMSGAAAVLAAMGALAEVGCPHEVHAVMACCENLVSGRAYKLGDVLSSMDGTTVEINNTDAEGRLTLGDAMTYVRQKVKPDEMFDFATLTGACIVALGPHTAGVMSDHEGLVNTWLAAARTAGEDMWRLPLIPKLKEQLKSPVADMKNTGERYGGAITAGLFLKHFARDTPWVHVDIAGPSSTMRESGAISRGGTGFAVATILEYLGHRGQ